MEDDIEQHANISQGPVFNEDLSARKSVVATEQEFINRSQANFGRHDGTREKDGTQEDYFDGTSAMFSNPGTAPLSKSATE